MSKGVVHIPNEAEAWTHVEAWSRMDEIAVVFDCPHTTPTLTDHGPYVARSQDIRGRRFDTSSAGRVSEKTYVERIARAVPEYGDLLYSREGTYFGISAPVPRGERVCLGQRMTLLRPDPAIVDHIYLNYWLNSDLMERFLAGFRDGSVAQRLNMSTIRGLPVPILPISEQRHIARTLQILDDKIELNRRMSATLEEMARALYRSWFVDFDPVHARALGQPPAHMAPTTAALFPDSFGPDGLPKGWEAGTLGDIASNVRRQVQPGDIEAETPYIGLEHMPRHSIALAEWGGAGQVGSAKSAMRSGQILFGKLRPYFHKVGIVPTDGICSTDILVIDAKADRWRELVLSVVSSEDFVEHANATSSGTRMPRSNWKDMARYDIAIPPESVVEVFSSIVRPMTEKIAAGIHEAHTLAALRDTLLPRLMSGELRIREAERQVEEVLA